MNSINLVEYATYQEKIDSRQLAPAHLLPISRYQLFMAHTIDLLLVLIISGLLGVVMKLAIGPLLVTQRLQLAADHCQMPSSLIFLLTFTAYFFTSFYFNHGQSYGKFRMKYRVALPAMNLPATLKWIAITGLNYLSLGQYVSSRGLSSNFVTHDFLYQGMMMEKSLVTFDLLQLIEKEQEQFPSDHLLQAA